MAEEPPGLILVTGGTGYVGTILVPLLAQHYPVRVYCNMAFGNAIENTSNVEFIKGDLRDAQLMQFALRGVNKVVHLAGIVTSELVAMNEALSRKINVEAMGDLIRMAREVKVRRFVYASSSSVYGFCEEPAIEETMPKPMDAYAQTKLEGEDILKLEAGAMEWAILRSATCCGPAPRMRLDTIVNIFCKQAWFDGEIRIFGGDQWRSNVHVRDAARAYQWLLKGYSQVVNHQTFNLTKENHTALALAQIVNKALEKFEPRQSCRLSQEHRPDPRHYQMDSSKIRLAGFVPEFSLMQAAKDNFAFFRSQANTTFNPNADIYTNTKRMADFMQEKTA